MPTSAVTTTRTVNTTGGTVPDDDKPKATKRAAKREPKPDPQEGAYRRRTVTLEDGTVAAEEIRPGSKAWVRV